MKIDNMINSIEAEICGRQETKNINFYAVYHLESIKEYLQSENLEPEIENVSKIDWSNGSLIKTILNGAKDFKQWSDGGLGLIYNDELAKTLLSLKRYEKWKNSDQYIDFLTIQAGCDLGGYRKIKKMCEFNGIKIKE